MDYTDLGTDRVPYNLFAVRGAPTETARLVQYDWARIGSRRGWVSQPVGHRIGTTVTAYGVCLLPLYPRHIALHWSEGKKKSLTNLVGVGQDARPTGIDLRLSILENRPTAGQA